MIAILETKDREFVNEAAKRGIFAYVTDGDPQELHGAVDIVLRRFAEFHRLDVLPQDVPNAGDGWVIADG